MIRGHTPSMSPTTVGGVNNLGKEPYTTGNENLGNGEKTTVPRHWNGAWDGNAMGIYQKDPYLQTIPQFKIRQFYHLGLSMTFQNQQVFVTGYKIVCTNRLCQWQEIQVFGISYRARSCLLNIRTEAKAVNQIQQVCNFGGIRISTDFFSFINIRILVDKIVFEKDLFCPLINR